MTALARKLEKLPDHVRRRVRLKPVEYVDAVADHITGGDNVSARCCRQVLAAIARKADWASWTWGAHAYRSAAGIGEEIHYSDRAVRYAYRALVAGGWLQIDDRPGRTNIFTVLRPVEPLAIPVDNPVHNRGSEPPRQAVQIAGGAASAAADRTYVPKEPPPLPPSGQDQLADGAGAPAHPPPRAAAWGRAPTGTGPPSPAEPGSGPHRGDAVAELVPETAGEVLGGLVRGLDAAVGDPSSPDEGDPLPALRWTRHQARQLWCPTCGVKPGEPCRAKRSGTRQRMHRDRRPPRL